MTVPTGFKVGDMFTYAGIDGETPVIPWILRVEGSTVEGSLIVRMFENEDALSRDHRTPGVMPIPIDRARWLVDRGVWQPFEL